MDRIRDFIEGYVGSIAFPTTFALLSFLGWALNYPWPFAIIESLLCFLPLLVGIGRTYMAPMLLMTPLIHEDLSFKSIPLYASIPCVCYLVSVIMFIFLNKCKYKLSFPSFSFLGLMFVFLLSSIVSIATTSTYEPDTMFYVIGMIIILLVCALNCNVMEGNKDNYIYLSDCIALLSVLISVEIFYYYGTNPNDLFQDTFNVGWATTKSMVSTILTISLTSFAALIYHKRWESLLAIVSFAGMLLLASPSGLLTLIIGFIPLVLISFRSYGKYYPYISLFLSSSFVIVFSLLLGYLDDFRDLFIEALHSLSFSQSSNSFLYTYAIDGFKALPIFGPSAQGLVGSIGEVLTPEGMITPLRNTIMTTMYMGGSIGLVAFAISEISVYYTCFRRKSKDKWAFLLFLLTTDFVGLTDNTIFNLFFLVIYLLSIAAFENSSVYDRVKVNDSYYQLTITNKY